MSEPTSPTTIQRVIGRHPFQLTAKPLAAGKWRASITGHTEMTNAPLFERPIRTPRGVANQAYELMNTFEADGDTPEAAIDALTALLTPLVREATRIDLDEINRTRRR